MPTSSYAWRAFSFLNREARVQASEPGELGESEVATAGGAQSLGHLSWADEHPGAGASP